MPEISVIVPVFNAEKYLSDCINSILSQTCPDFELILIDDGSTDQSGIICDRCAAQDSRIKVIHKKNGGVSAARNKGIEHAEGKYLTFVDSDDTIDEDFFEHALNDCQHYDCDLFISGLSMETYDSQFGLVQCTNYGINEDRIFSVRELFENMEIAYPQICICGPCCKLYKNSIVEDYSITFDSSLEYGEDTNFNLDYLRFAGRVYFSSINSYHYRRVNSDSLFGRFHKDTYEVHAQVYGKMRVLMKELSCDTNSLMRFEAMYFNMLIGGLYEYYRNSGCCTKVERANQIKKIGNDSVIVNLRINDLSNTKMKVLLCLYKIHAYCMVGFIFHAWNINRKLLGWIQRKCS